MSQQVEKPGVTPEWFEKNLGERPAMLSGGMIQNFREGWAHDIFSKSSRSHYFRRDGLKGASSICGQEADVRHLYGAGTWPHCQRCLSWMQNRGMNQDGHKACPGRK